MAIDVYAPCPCGSGKKTKFCCAPIVEEMQKAQRLLAGDQPRQALQIVDKIEKSHPDNAWAAATHAEILLSLGETDAAKNHLEAVVKAHPEYAPALAQLAIAMLMTDGYEAARPAIQRA